MRTVYRLLGLIRRYGPDPVETACARALDVVSVTKIASMLTRTTENTTPALLAATNAASGRFARDPAESTTRPDRATTGGPGLGRTGPQD